MTTKILAISSGKGGVGKTTVTLNLARQLSLHGFRTLLIDFDIHNKGATCLFMDKVENSKVTSITGLMTHSSDWGAQQACSLAEQFEILDLGYKSSLFLIPAARPEEMIKWETFVTDIFGIVNFMESFIRALAAKHGIEVVLIDCYGGIDTLTISAAGIADDFVVINEPDVITFAGTLLLYKQIEATYKNSPKTPKIHFIINRISGRYSFDFLQREYRKHLSTLAVDRTILAYLPFDKLVFDTFGDYPFFSELLPRGLYAKKIRELLARLWPEPRFQRLTAGSARARRKIYESTAENPFADPERIFQIWKVSPVLGTLPIVGLILLFGGYFTESISFFLLRSLFYLCLLVLAFVALVGILFEPWQVSRWLLRKAKYERRRRRVLFGPGPVKLLRAAWDTAICCLPATVGVLCFSLILLASAGENLITPPFRNVAIWQKRIRGFQPGGHYDGLILSVKAVIEARTNLANSFLNQADLASVLFPAVNLDTASLKNAKLDQAKMVGGSMNNTVLDGAQLTHADLSASSLKSARFLEADLSDASLWGVQASGADFSFATLVRADFRQADLRGADFSRATIQETRFEGGNLTGADFSLADFSLLNDRERPRVYSQLIAQGAKLDQDQIAEARDWESTIEGIVKLFGSPEAILNRYWWLWWNVKSKKLLKWTPSPVEPSGLYAEVNPLIKSFSAKTEKADSDDLSTKLDLLELMLIRGRQSDFDEARRNLAEAQEELGRDPRMVDITRKLKDEHLSDDRKKELQQLIHYAGVVDLLRTLLSILQTDSDKPCTIATWKNWLTSQEDKKLSGWEWETWKRNFPARRYSMQQLAEIRAIELAAEGSIKPEQMMWWLPSLKCASPPRDSKTVSR